MSHHYCHYYHRNSGISGGRYGIITWNGRKVCFKFYHRIDVNDQWSDGSMNWRSMIGVRNQKI